MNLALRCGRGHSLAKVTRGPSSQRHVELALPTACQRASRRSIVLLCIHMLMAWSFDARYNPALPGHTHRGANCLVNRTSAVRRTPANVR